MMRYDFMIGMDLLLLFGFMTLLVVQVIACVCLHTGRSFHLAFIKPGRQPRIGYLIL